MEHSPDLIHIFIQSFTNYTELYIFGTALGNQFVSLINKSSLSFHPPYTEIKQEFHYIHFTFQHKLCLMVGISPEQQR